MSNQTPSLQITLTMEQLRAVIREEIGRAKQPEVIEEDDEIALYGDLSDFPEDSYGSWDESLSL
jgi:hypothetical protein